MRQEQQAMQKGQLREGITSARPKAVATRYGLSDCLLLLTATSVICFLGVSRDSLWMDEGWTVWAASFPTVKSMVYETMINCRDPISQMPFYSFYIWSWAQLFGLSELALRLSNVPLVLLLAAAIQAGSIKLFGRRAGWAIVAASPFLCFYVNEIRPYVAVMAFAALATVSVLLYIEKAELWHRWAPWLCMAAAFILCGLHMLGVFLLPSLVTGLVIANRLDREKWRQVVKDWWLPVAVFLPLFLCLGGYYAWGLLRNTRGVTGVPGFLNAGFAWYEFTGFLGLGPPRNMLRAAPLENLFHYTTTLAIGISAWLVVMVYALTRPRHDGSMKHVGMLCSMFLVGAGASVVAAVFGRHSFWGRHVAEFFPLFILIMVGLLAGDSAAGRRLRFGRVATACLTIVWLLSATRLSMLHEYKKDDYRGAAAYAVQAAGPSGTILWAADVPAGSFYGLRFVDIPEQIDNPQGRLAKCVGNWTRGELEAAYREANEPIVFALTRPDVFDEDRSIRNWLEEKGAQQTATPNEFRIYRIEKKKG